MHAPTLGCCPAVLQRGLACLMGRSESTGGTRESDTAQQQQDALLTWDGASRSRHQSQLLLVNLLRPAQNRCRYELAKNSTATLCFSCVVPPREPPDIALRTAEGGDCPSRPT